MSSGEIVLVNITLDEHEQGLLLRHAAHMPIAGGPWQSIAEKITRAQDGKPWENIKPPTTEQGNNRLAAMRQAKGKR